MAKDYYIAKLFRQHNSTVLVVPGAICIAIGLTPGDHVVFVWKQTEGEIEFMKWKPEGEKDARVGADTDREHNGR